MGRKPRVDRTPEEKWQIVQEGRKSGNVSETCRRHDRPHRGVDNRTPHEAYLAFAVLTKNEALNV
jgi:hypothetical protein